MDFLLQNDIMSKINNDNRIMISFQELLVENDKQKKTII
jgi:hypothetical protein